MITSVRFANTRNMFLDVPLADRGTGYVIKSIEGLDPVKAAIVSSAFGTLDGAEFGSARRESRNIVVRMAFTPDFKNTSVASLRRQLYNYVMPKEEVSLHFYMDDFDHAVHISGRVESLEAPLFAKEPSVDISIICFDPDFELAVVRQSDSAAVTTNTNAGAIDINYEGTSPTGMTIELRPPTDLSSITIQNRPLGAGYQTMRIAGSIKAGERFQLITTPGEKAARIFDAAGATRSILYGVDPTADWPTLYPGVNSLRVYTPLAPFHLYYDYRPAYGGL